MAKISTLLSILLTVSASAVAQAATTNALPELVAPERGTVRALVIGIDAYRHVRALKGAVADAKDIDAALREAGTKDITTLIDSQVDRATVLRTVQSLTARTHKGDLIVFTIAGHGTQEPERVRGSEPDGMENVFLLPGFDLHGPATGERILGAEFNHFIKQFEARGAQVIFVADTCHGGGMTRSVDPRAAEMSFRQVPRYVLTEDALRPVSTAQDEMLTPLDFHQTTFLAAVDRNTKAPEVHIPGIPGLRGALSYAVARAFEGHADENRDGKVTLKELFTDVRQVVYELSDQRQNIVAASSPPQNVNRDAAFELTRGITLINAAPQQQVASTSTAPPPPQAAPPAPPANREQRSPPIKIATLDGDMSALADLEMRQSPFEVVGPLDSPDVVWDPKSQDVLAGGDVIAYHMQKSELPGVIDRAAAIAEIKRLTVNAPQPLALKPDDRLHHSGTDVDVEIQQIAGRSLVLFNIAGDGTVQALYPVGSDEPIIRDSVFKLTVRVREPFGADRVVAVTAKQPMSALQDALKEVNQTRKPLEMARMIARYAPADARVGSVGLYTGR
jgi:hypothetical protein